MNEFEIDDFLQKEIAKLSSEIQVDAAYLGYLIEMPFDKKRQLVSTIDFLSKKGCKNSFEVAIEDVVPEIDNGGSARFLFLNMIKRVVTNTDNTLSELADKYILEEDKTKCYEYIKKIKEILKDDFHDFFFEFSREVAFQIISEIDCDNLSRNIPVRDFQLVARNSENKLTPIYELLSDAVKRNIF